MSKTINVPRIIFTLFLIAIGVLVLLNRFGLQGDIQLLSDEVFFINSDYSYETQRTIFMRMVQSFAFTDIFIWVIFANFILLVAIYKMVSKINNNYLISFFQVIYLAVLAAFILRDIYIYFMFMGIWIILKNSNFFSSDIRFNFLSRHSLLLIILLLLLTDFRPLYTALVIIAVISSLVYRKIGFHRFCLLALMALVLLGIFLETILLNAKVYGLSLLDFLDQRAFRYGEQFNINSFFINTIQHYLAPLPWSLLERSFDNTYETIYPLMDDLVRMVYRSSLYCVILFITFKAVNDYSLVKRVMARHQYEIVFITTFCILNAFAYSLFLAGGGHERTKLFSSIFFFYLASIIAQKRI
jgi:hypothetical protein